MKTTLPGIYIWVFRKYSLRFLLLAVLQFVAFVSIAQTVTTGKSYVNITRPNGGTFLPGDTIEVRATIAVTGGSNVASGRINMIRYNDTINLAKFIYITGSLNMLSNEGRSQRPAGAPFTEAADTDSAHIDLVTGRLRFNIGNGAGAANVTTQGIGTANAGNLWGNLWPTFYNSSCIRMYVYRVRINTTATIVSTDTTVRLSAGNFRYRIGAATADSSSNFAPYLLKISPDFGLCSNAIGANALVSESGGTFGSGRNKNRTTTSPLVPLPYTFKLFSNGTPNDNFYGLANNTSGTWGTNPNVAYPHASRVFNLWDIIGDHTGAAVPAAGNPPADTTNPATNAGYALIINASYETNRAFTQTITNLCENTYYEYSAWFRNICRRCSCDSSGKGAGTTGYVAGPGNDSSGVRPNLTFKIDSFDYYTTGNLPYVKPMGQWVKKGFIYRTKPGQTSFTITIRNNAPGGGGNDWAIDDITVATCLPNMKYSPSLTPNICNNNALTIYDTVRSFFNNYVYFKWQRSTNGGSTWTDVTAPFGPVVPAWNGTAWEYVSSYTIPPTATFPANSGDKYRLIVATSITNLSDVNCRSTDPANTVTLTVLTCGPILNVKLISFNGKLNNNKTSLKWSTVDEFEPLVYDIEKSYDGNMFTVIGSVNGGDNHANGVNNYQFTDPEDLTDKAFYRIKMQTQDTRSIYSRILQLSPEAASFAFASVVNPFSNALYFDVSSAKAGLVKADLVDQFGKPIRRKTLDIREGINQFFFENTNSLPGGIYILKIEMGGTVLYKKVMKQTM